MAQAECSTTGTMDNKEDASLFFFFFFDNWITKNASSAIFFSRDFPLDGYYSLFVVFLILLDDEFLFSNTLMKYERINKNCNKIKIVRDRRISSK